MSKCKICGARIEDGTAVCPSCGAKVAGGTAGQGTTAPASMIRTTCPSCGAEVIGEHRFCDKCGANLKEAAGQSNPAPATQKRRCPSCGSILQTNSAFCPDCGASLSGSKPATPPTPQAATTTQASSSAPATEASRKVRLTLTPTSLCESPEFFHGVQDLANSKLMQGKGGEWMLEVEGELTEDEMNFICDTVIVPGRAIKSLDLSKCSTAYLLKDTQGSEEYLLTRCKALETIKLPNRTIDRNGKATAAQTAAEDKRKMRRRKVKRIIIAAISLLAVTKLVFIVLTHDLPNHILRALEEVAEKNPQYARLGFVTPLEYSAVSHLGDRKEKPLLAWISVHCSTQKNKNSALRYAIYFGSNEVLDILLKNGADVNHRISLKDYAGDTPLLFAVKEGGYNHNTDLTIQMLIDAGANVNAMDKYGKTALMIAEARATSQYEDERQRYTKIANVLRRYSR